MRVRLRHAFTIDVGDVTLGGEHVRGRRLQVAAAYLVLNRDRSVPIDELADVLWHGAPPPSWPSSLREVLSHVRKLFAAAGCPHAIRTRDRCVRIMLPAELVVDVEQAIAGARRLRPIVDGTASPPTQPPVVHDLEAMATMRGAEVLPGVDGAWLTTLRRQVDDARITAMCALADLHLRDGRADMALHHARRHVEEEPLSDLAHLLLMRCFVALGRRAEALASYQHAHRTMVDQLGVEPSQELQALQLEVLSGVSQPQATAPRGPGEVGVHARAWPFADTSPWGGVGFDVPLVGRAHALAQVAAALATSPRLDSSDGVPARVIVVSGERGVGRTRLLHELVLGSHLPAGPRASLHCLPGADQGAAALIAAFQGIAGGDADRVAQEAARTVRARRGRDTLTILVDDVHLADVATRRFVTDVARGPNAAPVVLVLTIPDRGAARPAPIEGDLHRAAPVVGIALSRLTAAEVGAIASAVLGRAVHRDVVADLIWRSGGVPLLLLPLLRAEAAGGAELGDPLVTAVWDLLAPLSPAALSVLTDAAAAGYAFDPAAMAGGLGSVALEAHLDAFDELIARRLIDDDGDGQLLRFRHGVVRDVLMVDPTAARRNRLRARLMHTPEVDLRLVEALDRRPALGTA